ncbi:MAG: NADP-dependent oxidoreductase [Chlamydiota bacterium]
MLLGALLAMKAIVLNGSNLSLEEKEKPFPQIGEVRIRVKAVGFNPVDWKIRDQWFGTPASDILGSDASGVVDAIGEGITRFKVGDEVYAMTMSRCSNGSYAEYTCIPEELLAKKPSTLSFEQAAAIPLTAMTAYRMTLAENTIKKGDTVFIPGAGGGVGTFATQFAELAKAQSIMTVAKNEKSKNYLHEHSHIPLDNILIYEGLSTEELTKKLIEMNGGNRFDVSVDLVGGSMKEVCLHVTQDTGTFVTIVGYGETYPDDQCAIKQVFVGTELGDFARALPGKTDRSQWTIYTDHMHLISQMLESGDIEPPSVHDLGTLATETVEQAHALLKAGRTKGKLIMSVP